MSYNKDTRDPYRDWSASDRSEAGRDHNWSMCDRYDRDSESSDRAYDNWRNGGNFVDPNPNGRFAD